jgi:hypothetical protein
MKNNSKNIHANGEVNDRPKLTILNNLLAIHNTVDSTLLFLFRVVIPECCFLMFARLWVPKYSIFIYFLVVHKYSLRSFLLVTD